MTNENKNFNDLCKTLTIYIWFKIIGFIIALVIGGMVLASGVNTILNINNVVKSLETKYEYSRDIYMK